MEVKIVVDEQRVMDLLCCAWEGGSNYWAEVRGYNYHQDGKKNLAEAKAKAGDDWFGHLYPFVPGVDVILTDASGEGDQTGKPEPWILNREALERGLHVMATKYPKHWADFLAENDDAETGDVFLQCCVFGETIFG